MNKPYRKKLKICALEFEVLRENLLHKTKIVFLENENESYGNYIFVDKSSFMKNKGTVWRLIDLTTLQVRTTVSKSVRFECARR